MHDRRSYRGMKEWSQERFVLCFGRIDAIMASDITTCRLYVTSVHVTIYLPNAYT